MVSVFDARDDLSEAVIERLKFDLSQNQISFVFDLNDMVREEINTYVEQTLLSRNNDLVSLWCALGWPEPDEYELCDEIGAPLIQRIAAGVRTALNEHERISDDIARDVASWAYETLETEHPDIDISDIDEDDAQELVRALA